MRVAMLGDYPIPTQLLGSGTDPLRFPPTAVVSIIESLGGLDGRVDLHVFRFWKGTDTQLDHRVAKNVSVHILPARRFTGMPVAFIPRLIDMRKALRDLSPDIVHGQGTEGGYAWMAVQSGFPNIITVHGILRSVHKVLRPPWHSPEHVGRWIEHLTLRRAKKIITISDFVRRQVCSRRKTCFPIPNAVPAAFFEVERSAVDPVVLFIGRITPEKGISDLIQAAVLIDDRGLKATIKIVGEYSGMYGREYQERCKRESLRLNGVDVRFVGILSRDQILDEMKRASCLVLPSYAESLPMVISEAMAAGTPAIAYDVGGVKEQITDGVDGRVVPKGDVEELASALHDVLSDPEVTVGWGREARVKAQRWRDSVVAERTLDAYESVLDELA